MTDASETLQIEECVRLACLIEATARKPGNVHPGASFVDLTYRDLVLSAEAVAPLLAIASQRGVGQAILDSVNATQAAVGRNANLGIILLLAPLAAVPSGTPLVAGASVVLNQLTREDAGLVYQAIRTANPGGMGRVPEQDISQQPTSTLMHVMRLAADRDLVAAQYATGFDVVFHMGIPLLEQSFNDGWETAVNRLHLTLMANHPDTLIARKCGPAEASQSAAMAQAVLESGWPESTAGQTKFTQLDNWLRARDNRRNPGTTADLVTVSLFAALREQRIHAPPDRRFHQSVKSNRDV